MIWTLPPKRPSFPNTLKEGIEIIHMTHAKHSLSKRFVRFQNKKIITRIKEKSRLTVCVVCSRVKLILDWEEFFYFVPFNTVLSAIDRPEF